jgi:hypothetical protein
MGQAEQDKPTGRAELYARTYRTGQAERERQKWDRRNRTLRMGQAEQDRQNRNRQNKKGRTG